MPKRRPYYGVIGNGETAALVSPSASIDWLCLPKFDGKILYARALDPAGGASLEINLFEKGRELLPYSSEQRYIKRTNILVSRVHFKKAALEVTDFMPWREPMIVRLVRIKNNGKKRHRFTVAVQSSIGRIPAKKYKNLRDLNMIYSGKGMAVGISFQGKDLEDVLLRPGEEKTFAIIIGYGSGRAAVRKMLERKMDAQMLLSVCKKFWLNWLDRGKRLKFGNKLYEDMYHRSLLAIKLLTYDPTGAVIAAPTTSFPATPGGTENWDYRFCWIRDAYFACKAFLETGHYREVRKQLNMLFKIQGKNGHWESPFYDINGKLPKDEIIIDTLRGPNREEMIRINNAAKDQLQLDSEGSIISASYLYYLFTYDRGFLKDHWEKIKLAANWIAENYSKPENGIWEFREHREHWIYGKVMCYVGLRSALNIAAALGEHKPVSWGRAMKHAKRDIMAKGWSRQRNSFLQTYESDASIDASALVIERHGLLQPKDPRIRKTVKLIEKKLCSNGGIKRYENAVYPFYLPTLWVAGHHIMAGDTRKAKQYIRTCINSTTNLLLCAEHFDPKSGIQYGNFPQAFCAAEFIIQLLQLKRPKQNTLALAGLFEVPMRQMFSFITSRMK